MMTEHRDILSFRRVDAAEGLPAKSASDAPSTEGVGEYRGADSQLRLAQVVDAHRAGRGAQPFTWTELEPHSSPRPVRIYLGRTHVASSVTELARPGTIVTLDCRADEPAEIVVDGQVVAYGRVVIVHGKMAVEVSRLVEYRLQRSA